MRKSWILPALIVGAGLVAGTAHAASLADYQTTRAQTTIAPLAANKPITSQFGNMAGKIIEVDGVASGIINGEAAGFLLQVDKQQTLVISTQKSDNDVTLGHRIRVLARVPEYGVKLASICVTWLDRPVAVRTTTATSPPTKSIPAKHEEKVAAPPQNTPVIAQSPARKPQVTATPASTLKESRSAAKPLKTRTVTKTAPPKPTFQEIVDRYAQKIQQYNHRIQEYTAWRIAYAVLIKSQRYSVDPRLVFALLAQESGFNPHAVSPMGARGLGQLMPGTAANMGIGDSYDISENIEGTIRYLANQLALFGGNVSFALAAYNAGPGNVRRYGGVPPFHETRNYVRRINMRYNDLTVHNL